MYNNINPKYKSFLFFLIKLSIIVGSLYFIYTKVMYNSALKFDEFIVQIKGILLQNYCTIPALLLFTFFNWFFEICKWKTLTNSLKTTSFMEATAQSLASLTVSLITPNRIGEYGAKALFFPREKKKIMLLNFIGNLNQLAITVIFGIVGTVYFLTTYEVEIHPHRLRRLGYLMALLIAITFGSKKMKLFGFFKLDALWNFVKKISVNTHLKIVLFSFIRYLIFSHQFYFLLNIFGVETDYLSLLYLIFTLYFIASFIPSISLFDWAIKGSVAIYVFAFIGVSEITIVTVTLLMWLLNFAIPAIIGSFFVLNFKSSKKQQ